MSAPPVLVLGVEPERNVKDEYDRRSGIDRQHLAAIAGKNFANARRNPNAQTREWRLEANSFSEDDVLNPVVEGRTRRTDCSQVTDSAAGVVLASRRFVEAHIRPYRYSSNVTVFGSETVMARISSGTHACWAPG